MPPTRDPRQGVLWQGSGFRVTAGGLTVRGNPSLSEWGNALRSVARATSSVAWGLGDLLLYADTRKWPDESVEQLMDATGQKRGSLLNKKTVSKTFPPNRRRMELPWTHHALVCSLAEDEQDQILDQAVENSWGYAEVAEHAKEARKRRERAEQTWPEGTFGLLYATPPWRSSDRRYLLDTDQIAAAAPRVQAVTAPAAILYLKTTNRQLDDALAVMKAWGFTLAGNHAVISSLTIRETPFQRERHWLLLVGTRGRVLGPANPLDSVWLEGAGSVAEVLEGAYPGVPRVLLYSDDERAGWASWSHSAPIDENAPTRAIRIAEDTEPETAGV